MVILIIIEKVIKLKVKFFLLLIKSYIKFLNFSNANNLYKISANTNIFLII